jgi:hypothetical protein
MCPKYRLIQLDLMYLKNRLHQKYLKYLRFRILSYPKYQRFRSNQ